MGESVELRAKRLELKELEETALTKNTFAEEKSRVEQRFANVLKKLD